MDKKIKPSEQKHTSSTDMTRNVLERHKKLEDEGNALKSSPEYKEYVTKSKERGVAQARFDDVWYHLNEALKADSDRELQDAVLDYTQVKNYKGWTTSEINEKLKGDSYQSLNFVEKEMMNSFINHGQALKRLDSELESYNEKTEDYNRRVKDHNTHNHDNIDTVEDMENIGNKAFDEEANNLAEGETRSY